MQKKWKGIGFILPHFIGVLVFFLIPYVDVFMRSLNIGGKNGLLANYAKVLQTSAFLLAAKNTAKFIVISLPLLIVLSLLIALGLGQLTSIKNIIKSIMLIPLAIPTVSIVLMWKVLFSYNGFLNAALDMIHVQGESWLMSDKAFGILVFSYLWKNMGYYVVLWLAILSQVPKEIYEACALETKSKVIVFFKITLPVVKNSVFMIVVLAIVNSFKVFREAYLVAGDYPDSSMYLLQHIFNNWFRSLEVNKMAAGAVLTSIPIFILVIVFQMGVRWNEKDS